MQKLISVFEFADKYKWEQQVLKDIGLEKFEQLVNQRLFDELDQVPYSDFTTVHENSFVSSYDDCTVNSDQDWQGARYWLNMERLEGSKVTSLNRLALSALKGGADGIILAPDNPGDLEKLLDVIPLTDCYLGIEGSLEELTAINHLLQSMKSGAKGFFTILDLTEGLNGQKQALIDLLSIPEFKTLVLQVPGKTSGGIDELVRLLCKGIFVIDQLIEANVPLAKIVQNIQIKLEIGDAYLWEICRLRCLRYLFHQVIVQYGLKDYNAGSLTIQATTTGLKNQSSTSSTSDNFGSQKAQNHQLIRNTTQSLAAILGGCNILTVIPHSLGFRSEDPFSRRIARNISHILREESNLHRVADPVAGAYYFEELTTKLCREVWHRLQELEGKGGYIHHINSEI